MASVLPSCGLGLRRTCGRDSTSTSEWCFRRWRVLTPHWPQGHPSQADPRPSLSAARTLKPLIDGLVTAQNQFDQRRRRESRRPDASSESVMQPYLPQRGPSFLQSHCCCCLFTGAPDEAGQANVPTARETSSCNALDFAPGPCHDRCQPRVDVAILQPSRNLFLSPNIFEEIEALRCMPSYEQPITQKLSQFHSSH